MKFHAEGSLLGSDFQEFGVSELAPSRRFVQLTSCGIVFACAVVDTPGLMKKEQHQQTMQPWLVKMFDSTREQLATHGSGAL